MKQCLRHILFLGLVLSIQSCTEDVILELPEAKEKYVVEGIIEPDQPPFVFLTRTQGFDQGFSPSALESAFVHDANISIRSQSNTIILDEICIDQIPDSLWPLVSELLGISVDDLVNLNYCVYSSLNPLSFGQLGFEYDLEIVINEDSLRAYTKINQPVPLDSLWFELWSDEEELGFLYAILTDPDTLGNAYRWSAKRISSNESGVQKDSRFVAPLGSIFDDKFFNGLSFEFAYNRGQEPNSNAQDDNDDESGFFKTGDTVVVKFSSIPLDAYDFYRSMENQIGSNGSPFATPDNVMTNINGGLGIWVGAGPTYDTIILAP